MSDTRLHVIRARALRVPRGRATARPPAYARHQYLLVAAFVVAVALVSSYGVDTDLGSYLLNQWLLYAIAAVGFYLIFCVAGRFAFCQTLMMATGAYTAAFASRHHGFWYVMIAGTIVVGALAALFGLLVRKATAFYFSVATLALGQLGTTIFVNWDWFTGPNGLTTNIPLPEVFGRVLRSQSDMTPLFLAVLTACLVLTVLIERSPLAREAIAARDLPELAASSGIRIARVQLVLFIVGSTFGAVSGALIAYGQGSVGTESFGLPLAIGIFLMPIIGGTDTMWGPVAGALLYVQLPNQLQHSERFAPLLYGVVLVLAIILLPDGIIGGLRRLGVRLRSTLHRRRRKARPHAED